MRRHSVIARLGPADTTRIDLRVPDSVATQIRFIDGKRRLGFGIGQAVERLIERGIAPSEIAVDLMLLAATVTAADTRISRASESQDSWTREIDLYVPVQDPSAWAAAVPLVKRALDFLTGDRWEVFVRERHERYQELVTPPRVLATPPHTSVCLFSGGLDSFTGAIDLLARGENPVLVSHYWDASTSSQEPCARRLGTVYGPMEPRHVRARVGFPDDLVRGSEPEKTTRGRSFLFFAMAVLAASGLKATPTIYVPENGLISLNVPLDPLRVGAWSTRTTHPFYMARWQELLARLDIRATFENPYRFMTKGEMLSACGNKALLKSHVADTISCASMTKARWKGLSMRHCGSCVPCLIRRAAITAAFKNDPTTYTLDDLMARPLNSKRADGEHVRSFQMMAHRLAKQPSPARVLVYKSGPLSDYPEADVDLYADVFERGIKEVAKLVKPVTLRPK
jgi:hypothetical protein